MGACDTRVPGPSASPLAVTMKSFARFASYFALGLLLALLLWSAISVYVLGHYEHPLGPLQVLLWLSIGAAIVAFFSVSIGVAWLAPGRIVPRTVAFITGIGFSVVSSAAGWFSGFEQGLVSGRIAMLWFVIGPAVVGVAVARLVSRPSS